MNGGAPDGKIVLLHGMGRTRLSMRRAAGWFSARGWDTRLVGYPSLTRPIEDLAEHVWRRVEAERGTLHFVTHSLGGLVLRRLVHAHRPARLGRCVMFAPPNRGNAIARRIAPLGGIVPALRQLALSAAELDALLGPLDFDVVIVAGTRPIGPLRWWGQAPNDGLVAVEDTGPAPHVVHAGHTFIMNSPDALALAERALRAAPG